MADIEIQKQTDGALIALPVRLDSGLIGRNWSALFHELERLKPTRLTVDASALEFLDGAGIAFLLTLEKMQSRFEGILDIQHLDSQLQQLVNNNSLDGLAEAVAAPGSFRMVNEELGKAGYAIYNDFKVQIAFLGELGYKLTWYLAHPTHIRWSTLWSLMEKAGADAINITSLLGFLIGLILAFQMAVLMAQFGAEVYVADAIVLVMFREMGPLITAFVLASRSGSAYAAEIGTMKVNEELDALHTFGIDPIRFLVAPRVLAMILALPLLTLFNIIFALFGAQAVMAMLGISSVVFWDRCQTAAGLTDLFSGLAKTFVFGYFIAAIGCLRGLYTGQGASAVGQSATSAVVSSIVMIVILDGVFAVVYYFLGI